MVDFHGWLSPKEVENKIERSIAGLVTLPPTPNYLESWPVKMFEYMRGGIPVIASNFPFWKSLLAPYRCALFVDPLSSSDIARGIRWIQDHPEKAREMGLRGRAAVLERFNWAKEEEKLLGVYKELQGKWLQKAAPKRPKAGLKMLRYVQRVMQHRKQSARFVAVYSAAALGFLSGIFRDVLIVKKTGISHEIFAVWYVAGIASLASVNAATFSQSYPSLARSFLYCGLGLSLCLLLGLWKIKQTDGIVLAGLVTILWILGGIFSKSLIINLRMFLGRAREAFASICISGLLLVGVPGKPAILAGVLGGCGFAFLGRRLVPPPTQEAVPNRPKDYKKVLSEIFILNFSTFAIFFWALVMNGKQEILIGWRMGDLARFSLYLFQAVVVGSVALLPVFTGLRRTNQASYFLFIFGALLGAVFYLQNSVGLILVPIIAAIAHLFAVYSISSAENESKAVHSIH